MFTAPPRPTLATHCTHHCFIAKFEKIAQHLWPVYFGSGSVPGNYFDYADGFSDDDGELQHDRGKNFVRRLPYNSAYWDSSFIVWFPHPQFQVWRSRSSCWPKLNQSYSACICNRFTGFLRWKIRVGLWYDPYRLLSTKNYLQPTTFLSMLHTRYSQFMDQRQNILCLLLNNLSDHHHHHRLILICYCCYQTSYLWHRC